MADDRQYDDKGDVIGGYLTPDEAKERGVEWHGRPNEPTPYSTPDEARGLNIPYRPPSEFPQYNYNNAYAATATQAPRTRGSSPIEQLMTHVASMNKAPGGWQSGNFALSTPQKQQTFPTSPSYWGNVHDYSNIPMNTPDEIAARGPVAETRPVPVPGGQPPGIPGAGPGSQASYQQYIQMMQQGPPQGTPPNFVLMWSPWSSSYTWVHPSTRF